MAAKIRLGETTVSGRLVSDPKMMEGRLGRQMTMLSISRVTDQAGNGVQNQGLEVIDVAIPHDRIPASEYAALRSDDQVTVRGESVITTVKNQEGVVELRQRMLAKEVTKTEQSAASLTASVVYSRRPIPWRVHELDEDGRHRLHIPVEELEKDPDLVNELVEYTSVEQYPFTDEILEKRRQETASDLEAAEIVSRQYPLIELNEDLQRDRYRRSRHKVGASIAKLPGGPISIVSEHEQETWQKAAEAEAERIGFTQDHYLVQLEVGHAIAENYGPQEVATWVDQYREQAARERPQRDEMSEWERAQDFGAEYSLRDFLAENRDKDKAPIVDDREAQRIMAERLAQTRQAELQRWGPDGPPF